jgi:hypothetical protein
MFHVSASSAGEAIKERLHHNSGGDPNQAGPGRTFPSVAKFESGPATVFDRIAQKKRPVKRPGGFPPGAIFPRA